MAGMLASIVGGALAGVGAGLVEDAKAQRDEALKNTDYLRQLALNENTADLSLRNSRALQVEKSKIDQEAESRKVTTGVIIGPDGSRQVDQAWVDAQNATKTPEAGRFTQSAGMGPDPSDPTKMVPGSWVLNTRTGVSEFHAGQVLTAKTPTGGGGASTLPKDIDPNLHGDDYLAQLPTDLQNRTKAVLEGRIAPPNAVAMKQPYWQDTMTAAMQADPTFDATVWGVRAKAMKDFSTGQEGRQVRSFSVAVSHLNTLDQLVDAMNNGDTQALNAVSNFWKKQTGQEAPTNFETAKTIVADEIVKAIIPGTGAGALADREKAAATISGASSPAQLKGAISTYKDLMVGQLHGMEQQYEVNTGRKDFAKFLSPDARDVLQRQTAPTSSPASAAGQDARRAYDALPSGATYKAPDGTMRTKR